MSFIIINFLENAITKYWYFDLNLTIEFIILLIFSKIMFIMNFVQFIKFIVLFEILYFINTLNALLFVKVLFSN